MNAVLRLPKARAQAPLASEVSGPDLFDLFPALTLPAVQEGLATSIPMPPALLARRAGFARLAAGALDAPIVLCVQPRANVVGVTLAIALLRVEVAPPCRLVPHGNIAGSPHSGRGRHLHR